MPGQELGEQDDCIAELEAELNMERAGWNVLRFEMGECIRGLEVEMVKRKAATAWVQRQRDTLEKENARLREELLIVLMVGSEAWVGLDWYYEFGGKRVYAGQRIKELEEKCQVKIK